MLTAKDQAQLESKGISSEQVQQQIENFRQGFPYMKLQRPAPVGDGIIRLTPDQIEQYIDYYQNNLGGIKRGQICTGLRGCQPYVQRFFWADAIS